MIKSVEIKTATGLATCPHCKDKIAKGEHDVLITIQVSRFPMAKHFHKKCFKMLFEPAFKVCEVEQ